MVTRVFGTETAVRAVALAMELQAEFLLALPDEDTLVLAAQCGVVIPVLPPDNVVVKALTLFVSVLNSLGAAGRSKCRPAPRALAQRKG